MCTGWLTQNTLQITNAVYNNMCRIAGSVDKTYKLVFRNRQNRILERRATTRIDRIEFTPTRLSRRVIHTTRTTIIY